MLSVAYSKKPSKTLETMTVPCRLFVSLLVGLHLRLTVDQWERHEGDKRENQDWKRGQKLLLSVTSPTCWTGFCLLTVQSGPCPPCWVSSFLHSLSDVQKCLNQQHHNKGDRQGGMYMCWAERLIQAYTHTSMSLCNKTKHTRGGDSILTLLFKPLFSVTTVLEDYSEQSGGWSPTKGCQHLKKDEVVYFWLKCVDVKSSRLILRVQDKEVYGNLG